MKVSFNWLKTMVDLTGISPEEAAEKLTSAGVECEGLTHLATGTNLVVGEILQCSPVEGSDHLHLLQVDEGNKYGIVQIVCGAPNARAGLKVIVARPGAVLAEDKKIEKGTIKGIESDGMCCSLLELGVDRKYLSEKQIAGIEELPEEAKPGDEEVLSFLGLDDTVLELSVLPNRPDILSVENVARELSVLFERPFKEETKTLEGTFETAYAPKSETPLCPQFSLIEVRGLENGPSPLWLRRRLEGSGIRSIDKIVDIGNYVMLLTGRPLNMYDADKVKGKSLTAKLATPGPWKGMDEKTYELSGKEIGIYDEENNLACLAGILTSDEARVDEKTKNVLVECAYFDGVAIRRATVALGLSSDSSTRFVRGIDPTRAERTLGYVATLFKELCEAKEISKPNTYDEIGKEKTVIPFTSDYINKRLGTDILEEEIVALLKRDGLEIEKDGSGLKAIVPSYRLDLKEACDLSEEVIRLLGYDAIKSTFPKMDLSLGGLTPYQQKRRSIRNFLTSRGLIEALTYSLVGEKEKDDYVYFGAKESYSLLNPLSPERKFLRKNLLPSLLLSASYNLSHQNEDFALFEVSDIDGVNYQGEHLAIVALGEEHLMGRLKRRPYDFYYAKGLFEAILGILGITPSRLAIAPLSKDEAGEDFHPYRSAKVSLGKKTVGVFGEPHPKARDRYGLGKTPAALFELDLKALLEVPTGNKKAAVPPRFPKIRRDLSLLIDEKVSAASLLTAAKKASALIKEAEVFDVYEGKGLPEGKKSVALCFFLYDETKTLREEEAAEAMQKAEAALLRLGAEVRS